MAWRPVGQQPQQQKHSARRAGRRCCKPTALSCRTKKKPRSFYDWLQADLGYVPEEACPFSGVCPDECKDMNAPFAIQNNTWMTIFTGCGGGGGLRGI
jgi:hypothetical protein